MRCSQAAQMHLAGRVFETPALRLNHRRSQINKNMIQSWWSREKLLYLERAFPVQNKRAYIFWREVKGQQLCRKFWCTSWRGRRIWWRRTRPCPRPLPTRPNCSRSCRSLRKVREFPVFFRKHGQFSTQFLDNKKLFKSLKTSHQIKDKFWQWIESGYIVELGLIAWNNVLTTFYP